METLDFDNLDFITQTPPYDISIIVSHEYTLRIPLHKRWEHFANANSLDEVKQELKEYLNPEGNYKLVSEKGILSTILTFVERGREPQKHPGRVGFFTHFKISPGISKKSLLEEEVINADEIAVGGD